MYKFSSFIIIILFLFVNIFSIISFFYHIFLISSFIFSSHFSSFSSQLSLVYFWVLFVQNFFSLSIDRLSFQRQTVDRPQFSVASLHTVCGSGRQLHCSAYFILGWFGDLSPFQKILMIIFKRKTTKYILKIDLKNVCKSVTLWK